MPSTKTKKLVLIGRRRQDDPKRRSDTRRNNGLKLNQNTSSYFEGKERIALLNTIASLFRASGLGKGFEHNGVGMNIGVSAALKLAGTDFIKEKDLFKNFTGWQDGYAAFTYSFRDKDNLTNYIKSQEAHHLKITFREELKALLKENGVEFEEKYLL